MKKIILTQDSEHLKILIKNEISLNGNKCDLNHIDVSKVENMSNIFSNSEFNHDLTNWKPKNLESKDFLFNNCSAPIPYWAEVEDTPAAVRSYWLNKELDQSLIDKKSKEGKIKI